MKSEHSDLSSNESFWERQERFKSQLRAVDLLEGEFLAFLWQEQPASPEQLAERFDRFQAILDKTDGLGASAVLGLFDMLEQRAFREVNKSLALAQTVDPEQIAQQCPDLPRLLVENAKAVHVHAFTTRQAKQNRKNASNERPGGRHPRRENVEKELQKWLDTGKFDASEKQRTYKHFIAHIQACYPELERAQTIRKWADDYIARTPSALSGTTR